MLGMVGVREVLVFFVAIPICRELEIGFAKQLCFGARSEPCISLVTSPIRRPNENLKVVVAYQPARFSFLVASIIPCR